MLEIKPCCSVLWIIQDRSLSPLFARGSWMPAGVYAVVSHWSALHSGGFLFYFIFFTLDQLLSLPTKIFGWKMAPNSQLYINSGWWGGKKSPSLVTFEVRRTPSNDRRSRCKLPQACSQTLCLSNPANSHTARTARNLIKLSRVASTPCPFIDRKCFWKGYILRARHDMRVFGVSQRGSGRNGNFFSTAQNAFTHKPKH